MRNISIDSLGAEHADNIQNIILGGGSSTTDILEMFPHCDREEIESMVESIAKQCWFDNEEWGYFGL